MDDSNKIVTKGDLNLFSDELRSKLQELAERQAKVRSIDMLEGYAQEISNNALAVNMREVSDDAYRIIHDVKTAFDNAVQDLEKLANILNTKRIAGYKLLLILVREDGTRVTVDRNIMPQQKDQVVAYFNDKHEVTQAELDEFDKFLATLK